jgi:hypothetical protein
VQTEVAFQASVSARVGRASRSPVIAARQRGNSSARGPLLIAVHARATPTIARGVAAPVAAARPSTVRRERRLGSLAVRVKVPLFLPFSMMILPRGRLRDVTV